MEKENSETLIWSIIIMGGLTLILVLSKINIELSNMYPEVSSVILGVHGIGIVVGILMCAVGGLLGLLFLNIFKYVQTTVKKSKVKNEKNDMDI
jgi:uncharacterized integral membrane protein